MQPEQDYYKLPSVSQSSLKVFLKSPADYKYQFVDGNAGFNGTAATNLGSLVHCMLLEPNKLEEQYEQYLEASRPEPDKTMASNANKAWKASLELLCQTEGKQLVPYQQWQQADSMVQVLCAHWLANATLFPDDDNLIVLTELYIPWEADCSDLQLKSKLDRLIIDLEQGTATVIDYKTTSASSSQEFGWSVKKYGYDIQAAFYHAAAWFYLQQHYPEVIFDIQVLFIPQRTTPPYPVLGVFSLDQQTMDRARTTYERALQELEGCLHTRIWETSTGIETLQLSKPLDLFPDAELIMQL